MKLIRKGECLLILMACSTISSAQEGGAPGLDGSSGLQWKQLQIAETTALGGRRASKAETAIRASGLNPRIDLIQPILQSPQDLSVYLTGDRLAAAFDMSKILDRMQVVPGLPDDPRYKDPRYDRVRDAFTPECVQSTQNYRSTALELFATMSKSSIDAETFLTGKDVESYDRECLTPLDRIPEPIKRVVGILVTGNEPFCAATVVGRRKLLTSKHCFVDADKGHFLPSVAALAVGQVSFVPLVQHRGRSSFTVAQPPGLPQVAFDPRDDYLVLEVKYWDLEHAVALSSTALDNNELPLPAWIVGSNATLSDVPVFKEALALTRGSGPLACSVLRITANQCIYHSCQTGPKTSGAGILVVDSAGTVQLVGVHKGPMSRAKGCEDQPPFEHRLNLAAAILNTQLQGL